ncbi:hypothetical protein RR45_GL001161 [Lactococcus chungangensis CAU 28 = DSM 22330]|uniref:Uncharacterized protein n=1 Tax=Pseudolactococcus chungangensis CAU 28 = DSM 22330 TaxID=1122154 RepID=A0A1K2HDK4_9LACT|nr:hypothetical protein [Lactococcus chungangensis]PCS01067.1 hypothetical protein RR45_GL001161 [Lactococcus chungangensis CAU 28 = DSM 22330]SFZ74851.1 hypothetical protein SAMN02746068_01387 [Lactococcus chungangensis CAU 28 = DSM 22330]
MNNLNETIGSIIDADRVAQVMLERESLLSDITRLTHALDAIQGRQKKEDYIELESDLVQLRDQYVQTTDELAANAVTLTQLEHGNALLSDANMVLANEVASDTQLFDKHQRENASNMAQLKIEKDSLRAQIEAIQAVITVKEAENQALDQSLAALEQTQPCCDVDPIDRDESLLIEQAEIADLFINLRATTLEQADAVCSVSLKKS